MTDPARREAPRQTTPDRYLSIAETCSAFGISRSTFYRMVADPQLRLEEILVRVPPGSGRIKVPARRFEEWLRRTGRL